MQPSLLGSAFFLFFARRGKMPVFTDAIEDSAIVVIAKENRLIHIMFFLIPCVLYNTYNYVLIQNTNSFFYVKSKSNPDSVFRRDTLH